MSQASKPWIIKFLAKSSKDIIGQDNSVRQLKDYIVNYKQQKKKAAIIYGQPGTGKTSSVYAIGEELQLEVVEVNASDFRNKKSIEEFLGSAMKQMSLFAKSKIILVDEIDGLSGTKDRGGLQAVIKLIEKSAFPVILTSLNPYDQKFSSLRKKCNLYEFKPLEHTAIYEKLKMIAQLEKIEFEEFALKSLARRAGGDMRAAINDFQTLAGATKKLTKDDLKFLSDREQKEEITSALVRIFKSTNANIAVRALDNVDEDLDKVLLWLDENLPKEYPKAKDLARAYEALSRADVYKGRIRRWQHWRFMVYISALLTAGVAVAKDEKSKAMTNYEQSKRPLKIWMANMKYMKRKSIAEKIASGTHSSTRQTIQDSLPYLQQVIKHNKLMGDAISDEFELDKDEVAWLKK